MKKSLAAAFAVLVFSAAAASSATLGEDDAGDLFDAATVKVLSIMSGSSSSSFETSETEFDDEDDFISPVPVPAAGLMLLAGLGGLAVMRRRNRA